MQKYRYYLISIINLIVGIGNWPLVVMTFLGKEKAGRKRIRLRKSGMQFHVRGKMDIWSVKEALIDRFYEKVGVPIQEGWTIVDIGAGIGEFTLAAAAHPSNRIYAFEPFAESFELLQANIRLNRVENVQAFPDAVWGHTGTLWLDLSEGEPLKIQSLEGEEGCAEEDQRCVDCVSLTDCLDRLRIERVDLLKLDCEGAEYPILFKTSPEVLNRIQRIVMEFHDGIAPVGHQELATFLEENGYRVRITQNQVHSWLGYLYAERVTPGLPA